MTATSVPHQRFDRYIKGLATPLSSIFGSGFLVIVSVLASATGPWALPAMAGICILAYATGSIIRFNIGHAEPVLGDGSAELATRICERLAAVALVPAYIISVTLYLNILSSYALRLFNIETPFNAHVLTTLVLAFILVVGVVRGLEVLEGLERFALSITIMIVALIIAAFAYYDLGVLASGKLQMPAEPHKSPWQILTVLGGTLIVVQGFETSRYMGHQYDAQIRIRACRNSQIISTVVYLLLIALATPMMHLLPEQASSNGLMVLAGAVAAWLPAPLVFAAIFSQFSAATADTIGASGNMIESTHRRIGQKASYIIVAVFALMLTWVSDTLELLALASRAFALYYFLQALVALTIAETPRQKAFFAFVGAILLFITAFAVPVG